MTFTNDAKKALLQGLASGLNKTGDYATLKFYGTGGELLSTATLDNPAGVIASNVSSVTLTFKPVGEFSVDASGTLTSAKVFADDGGLMLDGLTVGVVDTDIVVDKVAVQLGGLINISEFVIRY